MIAPWSKNLKIMIFCRNLAFFRVNHVKNVEILLISMLLNSKRGKNGQPRFFFWSIYIILNETMSQAGWNSVELIRFWYWEENLEFFSWSFDPNIVSFLKEMQKYCFALKKAFYVYFLKKSFFFPLKNVDFCVTL